MLKLGKNPCVIVVAKVPILDKQSNYSLIIGCHWFLKKTMKILAERNKNLQRITGQTFWVHACEGGKLEGIMLENAHKISMLLHRITKKVYLHMFLKAYTHIHSYVRMFRQDATFETRICD